MSYPHVVHTAPHFVDKSDRGLDAVTLSDTQWDSGPIAGRGRLAGPRLRHAGPSPDPPPPSPALTEDDLISGYGGWHPRKPPTDPEIVIHRDQWRITRVQIGDADVTGLVSRILLIFDAATGPVVSLDMRARAVIIDRVTDGVGDGT